jgi:hypothetical protein
MIRKYSHFKTKKGITAHVQSNIKETTTYISEYPENHLQLFSAGNLHFSNHNVRGQENGHDDQHLNADDQQF